MESFPHSNTNRDLLEKGAIVQRDRETYAIAPHLPGGLVDADTLIKIGEAAKRYNAATLKVTNAQRIAIVGIRKEDVDRVWADLGMKPGAAIGLCVRSVKFCPGTTFCKRGQQDSVALGMELDRRYHGLGLPGKFKIAVSGCANRCTDIAHRDVGIMGTPRGFNVYVGGTGGVVPREGDLLREHCTDEEVLLLVDQIVNYYRLQARRNDRLGRLIDRLGLEPFRDGLAQTEPLAVSMLRDGRDTEYAGEIGHPYGMFSAEFDGEFDDAMWEGVEAVMGERFDRPIEHQPFIGLDDEFNMEYFEGFGSDNYTDEEEGFASGDRAVTAASARLVRQFADGMSELESGADPLPDIQE